jgi:hypothetical protein
MPEVAEEIIDAASGDLIEGVEDMGSTKKIMPDNPHKSSTKQRKLNGGFISAKQHHFRAI